jgi:very-short-patch-repair endonuclease
MATEIPSLVRRALDGWRKRLLDLSKRNALLYYRRTQSNTLSIALPDMLTVADSLDEDGPGWTIELPPEDAREEDTVPEIAEAATPRAPRRPELTVRIEEGLPDRLIFDEQSRKGVEKRLRNLMRRSETDINERGVHILYFAAGFLEWRDPSSSEAVRSPLLLFPVDLERDSLFDPWRLVPAEGEELLVNPALIQKMSHDFRLDLPDLTNEDRSEGAELCRRYFETLRAALQRAAVGEWKLHEEGVLDLFTFHKLVMYRDLEQNASKAEAHSVIQALAGASETSGDASDIATEHELDERLRDKDVFQVLDADSSQLAALEAVRAGHSLVLRGPPGTGKSQTISNLIGQALADRKTVLFVSEKMAALDVVKKRLTKAHLGALCLELHSHKTNRRLIVEELNRALDERLAPDRNALPSEEEFARLTERRSQLREYVEALHARREPLGRSVAAVLGELAHLDGAQLRVLPELRVIATMEPGTWVTVQQLIDSISRRWRIVAAGATQPWFGLRPIPPGLQTGALLREGVQRVHETLASVEHAATIVAAALGLRRPTAADEIPLLLARVAAVEASPGVPRSLVLHRGSMGRVVMEGKAIADQLHRAETEVLRYFGTAVPPQGLPPSEEARSAVASLSKALERLGSTDAPPPSELLAHAEQCDAVVRAADALDAQRAALVARFAFSASLDTVAILGSLARTVKAILGASAYVPSFFTLEGHADAQARLEQRATSWTVASRARSRVVQVFDASVLDLDLTGLLEEFRTRYRGVLRYFLPAYYRDARALRRKAHQPLPASRLASEVEKARAAQVAMKEVADGFAEDQRVFGSLARGHQTDGDLIRRLLAAAEEILQSAPQWPLPPPVVSALCAKGRLGPDVRSVCAAFLSTWQAFEATLTALGADQTIASPEVPLTSVVDEVSAAAAELRRASHLVEPGCRHLTDPTWERIIAALAAADTYAGGVRDLTSFGAEHAAVLGPDYQGPDTDWDGLGAKAEYARELQELIPGEPPVPLLDALERSAPSIPGSNALSDALVAFNNSIRSLTQRFAAGPLSAPTAWAAIGYSDARRILLALERALPDVDDILAVEAAKDHLQRLGFLSSVRLFLDGELDADGFRNAARRSILQAWTDVQAQQSPCLATFRGSDHEAAIEDFRQLDAKLIRAAPHRIMERAGDRTSSGTAGEVGLIRREAAKRRKHIPLRKLFAQAPTIIPRLKPCFLMSPLSVAQFLKDSPIAFDIVVFDEASQIFPEDGVGAIMRARQVVVAGDDKQLPPTSFFQATLLGDSDDDGEDPEGAEQPDYASILDACSTTLPRAMLRWHYRSRHESLITFSNSRFYDSRLVTFPSSTDGAPNLGVTWQFVSEGVYDRGKSRTNPREAERIVELIVQHWRTRPNESLGVVTLSQAQMERLDDLLLARIGREPELEAFYRQEHDERFFVKNLENVQGDERDRIILGIGYGKDARGILTAGFGPLNRAGGERRLNVAVTRAKRELTVVSSFRYADLNVTAASPPGVLHLHKFLEFAERGPAALETAGTSGGDAESPLEESVASFLTSRGFDVEPQVGCSGFRIDMAVRDPALPGRFLMGVECDGATYHSAATVRDRDRLRQQVLEDLGWRIHRIWGPDWVRNRHGEEERLIEAIGTAMMEGSDDRLAKPVLPPPPIITVRTGTSGGGETTLHSKIFTPAQVTLAPQMRAIEPHLASTLELAGVFASLVSQENGISRERAFRLVADAWGIRRIGGRIRANFEAACGRLIRRVLFEDDFMLPIPYEPIIQLPQPGEGPARRFEHVPPGEVLLAVTSLLAQNGMMASDELARLTIGLYGESAALRARAWMDTVLDLGIESNRIRRSANLLQLLPT